MVDACCRPVPQPTRSPTPKPTFPEGATSNTERPSVAPSAAPTPSPTSTDPFTPEERACVQIESCNQCIEAASEGCGWCAAFTKCFYAPSLVSNGTAQFCSEELSETCASGVVADCEFRLDGEESGGDACGGCSGRGECVEADEKNCAGFAFRCECQDGFEGATCASKQSFLDKLDTGEAAAVVAGTSAAVIVIVAIFALIMTGGVVAGAAVYAKAPVKMSGAATNPLYQASNKEKDNPLYDSDVQLKQI